MPQRRMQHDLSFVTQISQEVSTPEREREREREAGRQTGSFETTSKTKNLRLIAS